MIWPLRKREPQSSAITLLGKLPCQGDFVREGWYGPEAAALDQFLVQARQALGERPAHDNLERWPTSWFCQCLPKRRHGLVGICAPSQDAAGRSFPVAIAHAFEIAALRPKLGRIFTHYQSFLHAAAGALRQLPALDLPGVRAELAALAPLLCEPVSGEASAAPPSAAAELGPLFAADPTALGYALYTIAAAFAAEQPGLTLDCPVAEPSTAQLWLTLLARLAERMGTTTCVLYAPDTQRLLIAIGAWNPNLLRAIAEPASDLERLWPLTTTNRAACEHAAQAVQALLPEAARSSTLGLASLADQLSLLSKTLRA